MLICGFGLHEIWSPDMPVMVIERESGRIISATIACQRCAIGEVRLLGRVRQRPLAKKFDYERDDRSRTYKRMNDFKYELVMQTIQEQGGSVEDAAEALGISRCTAYRIRKRYEQSHGVTVVVPRRKNGGNRNGPEHSDGSMGRTEVVG